MDEFDVKLAIGLILFFGLFGFLVYWLGIRTPDDDDPGPEPDTSLQCSFEGSDVFNSRIVDSTGNVVTSDATVDCTSCASYRFKDDQGCVPLGYDETQQVPVCQAGFRNVTGNWGVPPPKKC